MLIDGNMIISGFVSKGVNNLVDFGWKKIKDAYNMRKAHEQNIETRIYQVTVDAINAFTFNTYKNQDLLFVAAEIILSGFKSKKEPIEAVKTGLNILESQITNDRCQEFLDKLCDEICKDKNDILYKAIVLMQNEEILDNVHEVFKRSEQNQKDIKDDIHEGFKRSEQNHQEAQRKLDYLVEKADDKETNFYSETCVENRAEDYAEKWDKNVFLNDFNKRDKNAGVNVKLKDIYLEEQLPHYNITCYLRHNCTAKLNLRNTDLRKADLRGAKLSGAKLSGADLSGAKLSKAKLNRVDFIGASLFAADLRGVDLIGSNLSVVSLIGADLRRADLRRAKLNGVDLSGADLRETIFDEKQINMLHEKCDLSQSRVFISETNEIISYRDYFTRKQK